MTKFKVNNPVVNRWGKRFIAKDWFIEVTGTDEKILLDAGFKAFEEKKVSKKTKDENSK